MNSTHSETTILAIETATSACSVALQHQDRVFSRSELGTNIHSQVLLDIVNSVLTEAGVSSAELNAVAVGQGPGSFTGLRIGIGVAQGIAYGAQCPMIGVSSLDVLANQVDNGRVLAAIDARMGEAYWCEYVKSDEALERQTNLQVSPPEDLLSSCDDPLMLVGNAWAEYQARLNPDLLTKAHRLQDQEFPDAKSLLELAQRAFARGELIDPLGFSPEYVRNDVAKKSGG